MVLIGFGAQAFAASHFGLKRLNAESPVPSGLPFTTPFDMTVLNDLGHFHLTMDAVDRLPQTGDKGIYLKQQLKDKLVEHKQYIDKHGQDLPEIRHWKWSSVK